MPTQISCEHVCCPSTCPQFEGDPKSRPAVPFIADDIIETFDDGRSEEALRLFAEMSKLGQVIYLTHHGHLREMARKVCPSATFHELPSVL